MQAYVHKRDFVNFPGKLPCTQTTHIGITRL